MGVVNGVSADEWPEQGDRLGCRALVCFNYDTSRTFPGVVVRDDMAEPYQTIIRLDDGRHVLGVECQWTEDEPPRD